MLAGADVGGSPYFFGAIHERVSLGLINSTSNEACDC